ncbi:MAG: hypothetical protein RBT19_12055 [Tenuifilaceae bacterium]|jgi:hypothetical protein|nr:hypothetical protein [Tenuifilaceae bacterium]
MRTGLLALLLTILISLPAWANQEEELKQQIERLATELEAKYRGRGKVKVAILQFRTSDNRLTPFNQFMQDELNRIYSSSERFQVIDQKAVNQVLIDFKWSLEMSSDFRQYSNLSESIFMAVREVPEVFIYGQVDDKGGKVRLTCYLVPNGLTSTNLYSSQEFSASELTNHLLGKPYR